MILHYDPVLLFQMVTCCYQQLYYVQPLNKLNHSQALAIIKKNILQRHPRLSLHKYLLIIYARYIISCSLPSPLIF